MHCALQKMAAKENLQLAENAPQELICSICKRVMLKPQMVNCCEKQFCKDCLEKWLENKKSCPHCRSNGFTYMYMMQQDRKIGELKVNCPNRQHGCTAVLKYIECDIHLSPTNNEGCPFLKLDCPNNCETKVFRSKMVEHRQKLCSRRTVVCKHCKLQGEYYLIVPHVNKCPLRPVACAQGCGAQVIPKNLQSHKNDCPLEPVACSFSELGCNAKVCRRDLKEHVESTDHTSMVAKSVVTLRKDHHGLEEECATLTETCVALQDKYATLQNQHLILNDNHTLLRREHTALLAEHRQFKKEYDKLNARCTALEEKFQALKLELTSSKCKDTKNPTKNPLGLEDSDSDDLFQTPAPKTIQSLQAQKQKVGNPDSSKQDLDSNLFLWLFRREEGPGNHHIILAGHIKLLLEWEIDDLFADPYFEDITCFHFKLYLIERGDTQMCNVNVHVTSSFGDSGQLAILCCGEPQTIMWEKKKADASKQLIGVLHLQCSESDQIKVSFDSHQPRQCKCSCHKKWSGPLPL